MNAIINAAPVVDQADVGLYHKFNVTRTDGSSEPGGRHEYDQYFVLDLTDKHAIPALASYAKSCADEYPLLAADLRAIVMKAALAKSEFATVPETTLPNGLVVPAFQVSRYLCTVIDGHAIASANEMPTVDINYDDAVAACDAVGGKLIRETQALALAWNIYNVEANWSGGKVGEGNLAQGLHADTVDGPQCNDFEPDPAYPEECRIFMLSNGEIIYDAAGHLFTWVFDDVQGDERGLIAKPFTAESPSISTCPHSSMEKGVGWMPSLPCNWSGGALIRGGCWGSGADAGVFILILDWPDSRYGSVGFRCTK